MLTKKTLFASLKDTKRPPNGTKLRWRDKIMKDITVSNIKNWRRETLDKERWLKTINRDVTNSTVHLDTKRIVREHKERAANRRAQELADQTKQNLLTSTTNDATCTKCGRICKNKKGLKIHQHTCANKNITDIQTAAQNIQLSTTSHRIATTRSMKIVELLLKNNDGEYICPNQTYGRVLKPQGATSYVKACAKVWLGKKNVVV
jgi:hypothetical protein